MGLSPLHLQKPHQGLSASLCSSQPSPVGMGGLFGVKGRSHGAQPQKEGSFSPGAAPCFWGPFPGQLGRAGARQGSGFGATLRGKTSWLLGNKRLISPHRARPRLYLNGSSLKYSSGHSEHTKEALQPIMPHQRPGRDHTCESSSK